LARLHIAGYALFMNTLTEQQRQSVELRGEAVLVTVGPGCGQTHTLIARYLSHLAADKAHAGEVLVLASTERTARELRERIRAAIEKVPDAARHLPEFETAPIAALHNFCTQFLRKFAIPAGLDPGFQVLNGTLTANLRSDSVTACLHGLLAARTGKAATALRELIVLFGYADVVEAVSELVRDPDRSAWQAWLARSQEEIAAEWVGPVRAKLLPEWVAYLRAASPVVSRCLSLLRGISSPNAEVMTKIRQLLDEVPRLNEACDLTAKIEELCQLAKIGRNEKRDWSAPHHADVKSALDVFRAELPKHFELFTASAEGVAESARVGQCALEVAQAIDEAYRNRKALAGVLDYRDVCALTRDLLRNHGEIREQLQKQFRFLLVDDFQDFEPVQREILELLCGNELEPSKLFAIGEHQPGSQFKLSHNFRSQPGVVKFVNALFAKQLKSFEAHEPQRTSVGEGANVEFLWAVRQQEAKDNPAGKNSDSSLHTLEANALASRISELINDPMGRILGSDGTLRRIESKDIALLFRSPRHFAIYESALRQHGLDCEVVSSQSCFATQQAADVLSLLRAVANPHDSLSLVAALRSPILKLADEAIFLLGTHSDGLWAGLHDPTCVAKLPDDEKAGVERIVQLLASWRTLKDQLSIARLLNTICADTGYDAFLQTAECGESKLRNFHKLVELARSFDCTELFGLHEFISQLANLANDEVCEVPAAVPSSRNAIQIMCIHDTKGLDFPVVIVPDFASVDRKKQHAVARWHAGLGCLVKVPHEFDAVPASERRPFSSFAGKLSDVAGQLAARQEDLRLLHFACTRARDLLILSAALPEPPTPASHRAANYWTLALEERFDALTGRYLASDLKTTELPAVRVILANAERPSPARPDTNSSPPTLTKFPSIPQSQPGIVALPALEACARGEAVQHVCEHHNTEDDSDRSHWRTPRERIACVSDADRVLWAVLERWNFADMDGWILLLADALAEIPDFKLGDELQLRLAKFAESAARAALSGADDVYRNVEFIADLSEVTDTGVSLKIRGVIDLLYRDAAGWHILGIDRGIHAEDDPWRGRRPGLVLQAWAASKQLGAWPASIGLFDLATGQLVRADPRRFPLPAVAEHFVRVVKR
jgi:ATP-dependent helicase/nuclease subunit A